MAFVKSGLSEIRILYVYTIDPTFVNFVGAPFARMEFFEERRLQWYGPGEISLSDDSISSDSRSTNILRRDWELTSLFDSCIHHCAQWSLFGALGYVVHNHRAWITQKCAEMFCRWNNYAEREKTWGKMGLMFSDLIRLALIFGNHPDLTSASFFPAFWSS